MILERHNLIRNHSDITSMECQEKPVLIPSHGYELTGVLHLPAGVPRPRPVLFLHGFTGNKSESGRLYTDMARHLCSNNYASLRFDFRCHGDSPLPFEEFTITYAVEDAMSALSFLKTISNIDSSKLAIIGLSMGGGVAVKLAAGRDDVSALILLSPALDWPQLAPKSQEAVQVEGEYVYMGPHRMRIEKIMETMNFTVMDLAQEIKAPTLIVHALDDETVPISQPKRFYEQLRTEKKFLEVTGGHVFNNYQVRRRIEQEILSWISSHL